MSTMHHWPYHHQPIINKKKSRKKNKFKSWDDEMTTVCNLAYYQSITRTQFHFFFLSREEIKRDDGRREIVCNVCVCVFIPLLFLI